MNVVFATGFIGMRAYVPYERAFMSVDVCIYLRYCIYLKPVGFVGLLHGVALHI